MSSVWNRRYLGSCWSTPHGRLDGDAAFRLYDTFGMPYDFIEDTAATQDLRVDRNGFDLASYQLSKARVIPALTKLAV